MAQESTSSGSSLPFEIWLHIFKFLLDDHLRKLYSVNRAFFYIAMSLRYRNVLLREQDGLLKSVDTGMCARML